jgi:predicted nucleotidyltransferase
MDRAEVIHRLRTTEPILRAHGVAALYLFGSYARDTATSGSDIDVFVDPESAGKFGFDAFMESYEALQSALPSREIGFSTRSGIDRHIRPLVEREAVRVF